MTLRSLARLLLGYAALVIVAALGLYRFVRAAPSADHRILGGGTAYVTEAGMTGDYDSVIGMDKAEPLHRFQRKLPGGRFEPGSGEATLCGVAAEIGEDGLAKKIAAVRLGPWLEPAEPRFWNE